MLTLSFAESLMHYEGVRVCMCVCVSVYVSVCVWGGGGLTYAELCSEPQHIHRSHSHSRPLFFRSGSLPFPDK